ncbi:MAG: hypothetical protein JNM75_14975 [Rhodospirillales bacterium]|nr:hypothetical protein [Rhodospirillales bacterium]
MRAKTVPAAPEAALAARRVRDGAAILGASVLLDSAMEHYRGRFHNAAMYLAPATAAISIAAALAEPRRERLETPLRIGHALALTVGFAGLGFHVYNVAKRPGGFSWNNLFYAAPLGAPGALVLSGLLGLASEAPTGLGRERHRDDEHWTERYGEEGRFLAAVAGASLLAETAEVWLLHFRGAFHNPAMYLPVSLPPAAAASLLAQAIAPRRGSRAFARLSLRATAVLGFAGTGFHIYGVQRNMGGWRNWHQNALAGPPTPAPISFTGLALAGLAALDLIDAAGKPNR